MRIGAIIFDMDGVLVDSEPFICEAAIRMFWDVHGTKVVAEDFRPFVGAGEDRFIGGVAEKYGVKLTMPADKVRTYEIYLELIKGRLKPLAGVREFIGLARERRCRLAVATSADRMKMEGNLKEIGLPAGTFDALVKGEDVQRKKPAPDLFLLAAERMGVGAEGCLVIEDAQNGLRAAKAAGMRALGIMTTFDERTLREAGADWVARDLASVPAELVGLVGNGR